MTETTNGAPKVKAKPTIAGIRAFLLHIGQAMSKTVILLAEIALVGIVGAQVGNYLNAKTIVEDCFKVNMAKIGDTYVQCTVVVPKKDPVTAPPR